MDLKGRRALITGSTSGIGLGIAGQLAQEGCDIVLNGFGSPEVIEAIRTELQQDHGIKAHYIAADVSQAADCVSLAQSAESLGSGIDILVNNAGIQHVAPIHELPAERWDAILAVNLSSSFHLIAALLPGMRSRGWGRIINISSVHGLVASKYKSAYVATKHGLVGLTKVVALETAGQGVTCNAICPGWVRTAIVEAQVDERMIAEGLDRREAERRLLSEKQPSGQFSQPWQIGALAAFLCSEAAANITGASLPVDGAWSAQ